MALIKVGENAVSPWRGDRAPIRIYHGENKIAGWEEAAASGQSITAENTYNNAAHVEILGNAELQSDYVECWGGSSQDGTPSIDSPIEVTPLVPSGTYKVTTDHGIYEATIPDLHGIEDLIDKIVFDRISGKGYHLQKCGNADLTGDESFSVQNPGVNDYGIISYYAKISSDKAETTTTKSALSSILPFRMNGLSTAQQAGFMVQSNTGGSTIYLRVLAADYPDAQNIKNKLAELASAGTPAKIVWQLINPVSTSITFTKVDASDAPELPLHVFEDGTTPSYADSSIIPASGTLTTSCGDKQSTQTIPPLYGIKNADGTWAARDKLVIDDAAESAWVERNTSIIVLDGTENMHIYKFLNNTGVYFTRLLNENYTRAAGLCTHEAKVGSYTTNNDHYIWIGANNTIVYWIGIFDVLGITTEDDFKAYLSAQYAAGTPVTIVYALETPTIESIDYTAAKTYYPQTMIELTSNLPMDMSVRYKHF